MIISLRSLSYADLKKQLQPGEKVVISGCDQCVMACGISGPGNMQKLTDMLTQDGFEIVGQDSLGCGCMVFENEEHSKKKMYKDATAIISTTCESAQPVLKKVFSDKKVIATTKTVGTGNFTMDRGPVLTRPFEDTGLPAKPEGYDLPYVAEKMKLYASFFDADEVKEEEKEYVTIIVNGKKISAVKGQNLLSACLSNDIDIPHLCYLATLSSEFGACRLCMVKLKGEANPVASCSTQTEEGMEVITEDEELNSYRRTILELMIASGDHNCLTCTKGLPTPMAACELQALVRKFGIDKVRFEKAKELPSPDDSTPTIYYDPKRCISCGRCVCASREHGLSVLSFAKRGEMRVPVPGDGGRWVDSQCDSCMACVWVCPTGALNETVVRFSGPEWTPERKYPVL